MNFSKSKYCKFIQCKKLCWLDKYKPREAAKDEAVLARMNVGNQVDDLAMNYFGPFDEVTSLDSDGNIDIPAMIEKTKELLLSGKENICEASFCYDGCYCAVDILHRDGDGYSIYEVKSGTGIKDIYYSDVAYQKYVLNKCDVNVKNTYIMHINSDYVRHGELNLKELFMIEDVSQKVNEEHARVEANLVEAEKIMSSCDEPNCKLGPQCSSPYSCEFWDYCTMGLPKPSVFDIYGFKQKWECYNSGLISFTDVLKGEVKLSDIQRRQLEFQLGDCGTYIDRAEINDFLSKLFFPLYFLDFEAMQLCVPEFEGTRPYQQVPFQYSLHYMETADDKVHHKEFLAQPLGDPRRALAESICNDIPENVCTLAYNKTFECTILKKLAATFADLSKHLLYIANNVKDLLDPFKHGYYYNKAMGGSFSIKSVLPAVFPDDPGLNYNNLEGVHNGSEAMNLFPLMKNMPSEQYAKARSDLLKYCELDTFAMVKLYNELVKVGK